MSKKEQSTDTAMMGNVLGVVNKVAIAVILIVVVSLGLGTFLDRWLDTGRIFTLLLVLGSVPLTLTAVYKISMAAVANVQAAENKSEEDTTT